MKVSVVILNWNGEKLLEKFLPSVIENTPKNIELIVVDNDSTDSSIYFLKNKYPNIRLIRNKSNFGYAKGYNEAIKEIDTDLLILLNSDVELTKNWLFPILKEFEKDDKLAIAQPKILNYKDKKKFDYAGASGGFIDHLGYPYCRGRIFFSIEDDEGQYDDVIEIDWASGACLFIRKSVYEELGGIDEDFYLHMEEIDLCLRAKSNGYKIKVFPDSLVYHLGGGTLSQENSKKIFYNFRNSLYLILKNYESFFWRLFFRIVILDFLAGILFLYRLEIKSIFSILKAHFDFYKSFFKIYRKRGNNFFKNNKIENIVLKYFFYKKKYTELN